MSERGTLKHDFHLAADWNNRNKGGHEEGGHGEGNDSDEQRRWINDRQGERQDDQLELVRGLLARVNGRKRFERDDDKGPLK